MIGYLGSLQKRAEADHDAHIYRAQAEKEAKDFYEEQEKFEKQQKMQESIDQHRLQTVKQKFSVIKTSIYCFYIVETT
jgi:hypothetical protein